MISVNLNSLFLMIKLNCGRETKIKPYAVYPRCFYGKTKINCDLGIVSLTLPITSFILKYCK